MASGLRLLLTALALACLACTKALDAEPAEADELEVSRDEKDAETEPVRDAAPIRARDASGTPAPEASAPPDREALNRRLSELAGRLDDTCSPALGCALLAVSASCADACLVVARSASVVHEVDRAIFEIEERECRSHEYGAADCSTWGLRAVCRDSRCEVAPFCPDGCTRGVEDGVCRDAELRRCDGCPPDKDEPDHDARCSEPGLECHYGSACGARTTTCERNEAGELRWFVIKNLC